MKILIATPAYGGQATTVYCETLIRLLDHFAQRHPHVRFEHKFLSLSILPFMRNVFANLVMQDASYTHLLFVDADMGFAPSLIERMIEADKPVVGAMCPHRGLDLAAFSALREEITDPAIARLVAIDYESAGSIDLVDGTSRDGETHPASNLVTDGPCIRIREIGAGILLVKREVFCRIRERYPELWCTRIEHTYGKFGLTEGVLQCFEPMPDEHGHYCGEDIAFCRRWVQGCGGEIWAVVTETVLHVGTETFAGRYLTKLQHGKM
ncbi:hypothetical protein [Pseudorhodoplanes sp.]|uniref:hypothetical protein n=1 Tax=Pseudorhodoplanes sp. TaxID=1934341 RepID=UPI003919FC03